MEMKVNCQPSCKTTGYMLLTSKTMCENLFERVMGFMFTADTLNNGYFRAKSICPRLVGLSKTCTSISL